MTKEEINALYKVMFTEYPDVVSVSELKKMLRISSRYAYKLVNDGYIIGRRFGNCIKIPKINVIKYVLSLEQKTESDHD